MFWLNVAAIPLIFIFGWIFVQIVFLLRYLQTASPNMIGIMGMLTSFSGLGWIALLLSVILLLIVHELIHGIFFWLFTRERPKFAFRGSHAFAASPEWYLPKNQYIVVGISPLVIISILCVLIAIFVPLNLVSFLLFNATFNAAGALGDMIVVAWVIRQPKNILVQDRGDSFLTVSPDN